MCTVHTSTLLQLAAVTYLKQQMVLWDFNCPKACMSVEYLWMRKCKDKSSLRATALCV